MEVPHHQLQDEIEVSSLQQLNVICQPISFLISLLQNFKII